MKLRGKKQKKELAEAIAQSRKLLLAGQHHENFDLLEEAVQKFPDSAEIQLLYATILLEFRPNEVAAEAAKAARLGSDDPGILVRAAHLMFDRNEREAARSCTARANELVQPDFVLMSSLEHLNALFAGIDGNYEIAEEKLRSLVRDDPGSSSTAIDLAKLLAHQGRQQEALEVVDEALVHAKEGSNLERLRAEIANAPG